MGKARGKAASIKTPAALQQELWRHIHAGVSGQARVYNQTPGRRRKRLRGWRSKRGPLLSSHCKLSR